MQRSASEQRVNRNLAILGFNLEILDRPLVEPDPEVVDELLMPMTSSSTRRTRPPAPPTTSLSKGKKRKSAQSIQTPSASPRHQPVPVASTSNHRFTRDEKAYQEFRSRSQRDAERRVKDQVEERERYKRKHFSLSSRANPEPTVSSPRQARLNRRSLGKERGQEEEEEEGKEPERKSRKSEKDERIHYDDGRIFRNGQLVRRVGKGSERRIENEEDVEVKREESLEESDFDCLIVKAEEEEEGSERRSSTENEEGEEREQFALKQLGLEKQRLLRHSPLVLPFQPTPHQVLPTPHPRPRTQSQSDSLPSLASFLTSLDLPRLSRLIPHFHSIGVETSDELFALSSQTAVGKKRRENVMGMVEELERGLGREFKRFEKETVEGELEERRKEWVVSE